MPKQHKRLYTIGEFWLVPPDEKYPDFGISWYDKRARQTRRLGTERTDLEAAKTVINKHALERGDGSHQDELLLVSLQRYYLSYAINLAAAKNVRVTIQFVTEHSGDTLVSAFQADKQKEFVTKLREHGLSDDTIARHLTDIFAALSYAQQFNHLPEKIIPARLSKRFWGERTQPRTRQSALATKRALTMEEWGRIFDVAARNGEDGVRIKYLIAQLGTIGRCSAVIEVTGQQIDLTNGIVDLNPPGREQNKKRRPKVPICETFAKWLTHWNVPADQHLMMHRGQPIATRNFIRKVIREAKIPNCNPYTFRHSISSWLAWRGVSKWERKKAMGHAKIDGGSTDTYTHYDPTYLRAVAVALEELFQAIAPHTRFNLLRKVIEDQGAPETLWQGVPQAILFPATRTLLLTSPETLHVVNRPDQEFSTQGRDESERDEAGGDRGNVRERPRADRDAGERTLGGLERAEQHEARDVQDLRPHRSVLREAQPTEGAEEAATVHQAVPSSEVSRPGLELPTVTLSLQVPSLPSGAWRVRGEEEKTLASINDLVARNNLLLR